MKTILSICTDMGPERWKEWIDDFTQIDADPFYSELAQSLYNANKPDGITAGIFEIKFNEVNSGITSWHFGYFGHDGFSILQG